MPKDASRSSPTETHLPRVRPGRHSVLLELLAVLPAEVQHRRRRTRQADLLARVLRARARPGAPDSLPLEPVDRLLDQERSPSPWARRGAAARALGDDRHFSTGVALRNHGHGATETDRARNRHQEIHGQWAAALPAAWLSSDGDQLAGYRSTGHCAEASRQRDSSWPPPGRAAQLAAWHLIGWGLL
jgi:hypothetical protein